MKSDEGDEFSMKNIATCFIYNGYVETTTICRSNLKSFHINHKRSIVANYMACRFNPTMREVYGASALAKVMVVPIAVLYECCSSNTKPLGVPFFPIIAQACRYLTFLMTALPIALKAALPIKVSIYV